jgi:hypothetical protein
MRRFLIIIFFIPMAALAQTHDHDGHLFACWLPPDSGAPLDHYIWSYTINGVPDSVQGIAPGADTTNSDVTLTNIGDWAIFRIRAVSVMNDTSDWAASDTAIYDPGGGIGPPRGVNWIQGP